MKPSCAGYLNVSWLDIYNVSLGCGPGEGEAGHGIAKGEGRLTISQTHHVYRHLEKETRRRSLRTISTNSLFYS